MDPPPTGAISGQYQARFPARATGWPSAQPMGQRRSRMTAGWIIVVIIGALAMAGTIGYISLVTGAINTSVGFALALVPLAIVLTGAWWLDAWERTRPLYLASALAWGAGVAVVTALVLNTTAQLWLQVEMGAAQATNAAAMFVAPFVEEGAKGAGVLLIFLMRRKYFNGVLDGVVTAMVVAGGFAFTENILYFAQYSHGVGQVFVMRGVLSPFAHALFTSCTGIAIGLASRAVSKVWLILALPLGWAAAAGLHALWNSSAVMAQNFLQIYFFVHVPLFLAAAVCVILLRRQMAKTIGRRLSDYIPAGIFAEHEVAMFSSMALRRQARQWANSISPRAAAAVVDLQHGSASLGLARNRFLVHRRNWEFPEQVLLQRIAASRENLREASIDAGVYSGVIAQ